MAPIPQREHAPSAGGAFTNTAGRCGFGTDRILTVCPAPACITGSEERELDVIHSIYRDAALDKDGDCRSAQRQPERIETGWDSKVV